MRERERERHTHTHTHTKNTLTTFNFLTGLSWKGLLAQVPLHLQLLEQQENNILSLINKNQINWQLMQFRDAFLAPMHFQWWGIIPVPCSYTTDAIRVASWFQPEAHSRA
jgi:hypothetical protein